MMSTSTDDAMNWEKRQRSSPHLDAPMSFAGERVFMGKMRHMAGVKNVYSLDGSIGLPEKGERRLEIMGEI